MTLMADDMVWGCAGDGFTMRIRSCLRSYFGRPPHIKVKAWEDVTIDDLAGLDREEMSTWPNFGKKCLARFNAVIDGSFKPTSVHSVNKRRKTDRNYAIVVAAATGETISRIARQHGISVARVQQIIYRAKREARYAAAGVSQ